MFKLRSISKQIGELYRQIRDKQNEIKQLEARVLVLQKNCPHENTTEVEDLEGKGWISCDECVANLVRIY